MMNSTPHLNAFIQDCFKRINMLHVMHRASMLSVILFIIYIIDYPDPFYFFLLALFIVTSYITRTPQRYFAFTMTTMAVRPIKDIKHYRPIPEYWMSVKGSGMVAPAMYEELKASLYNAPNNVVSQQIQRIHSLRGFINYYDLLNIVLMLMATDKPLYNYALERFNFSADENRSRDV